MEINEKEIIRYLGYGKVTPDEQTMSLIRECTEKVQEVMTPRYVYRRFECTLLEDGVIEAAGVRFQSGQLSHNLQGCEELLFFAATLGNGVDLLMNQYSRLSISRAAILQAVGAAAMEDYCNLCQQKIADKMRKENKFLRPRFSPGYGDFSLDFQQDFLRIMESSKTVGIYLSDGGVMIPEKSVTAIIGVSGENRHCVMEGCEACSNTTCSYRR